MLVAALSGSRMLSHEKVALNVNLAHTQRLQLRYSEQVWLLVQTSFHFYSQWTAFNFLVFCLFPLPDMLIDGQR